MHPVKSPQDDLADHARAGECREALEGRVQQLVEEAMRAGWSREEVLEALRGIVDDAAALTPAVAAEALPS